MNILKKGLFYLFFHLNFVFNTITEKSKLVLSKKYIIPIGFSILNFSLLAWAWWRKENKNLFHWLALSSSGISAASYLSFVQKLKIKEKKKLLAPHLLLSLFAIDGLIMVGGYHHNNENNYNVIIYAGLINIFRLMSIFYDVNKEYEKKEDGKTGVVKFQKKETGEHAVNQETIEEIKLDLIILKSGKISKKYLDDYALMHENRIVIRILCRFGCHDASIMLKTSFAFYTWYILKMTLKSFISDLDANINDLDARKKFLGYKIWIKQQTLEGLKKKIIEDNDDNWRKESDQLLCQ